MIRRIRISTRNDTRFPYTQLFRSWIGSSPLRQEVTAETNKIESYNGFAKFFSFGGDVIAENDPDEQQKRLRYNDLIASAVILQNTMDMMRALQKLADRSEENTTELQSLMSNSYADFCLQQKKT